MADDVAFVDDAPFNNIKLGGRGAHVNNRNGRDAVVERCARSAKHFYLKKPNLEVSLLRHAAELGDSVVMYSNHKHFKFTVRVCLLVATANDKPVQQHFIYGYRDVFAGLKWH